MHAGIPQAPCVVARWATRIASGLVFCVGAMALPSDDLKGDPTGAVIYANQCARCHGDVGEGVQGKYDEPLYGDRSIASLARLIERTMPENDPEECVGDAALRVAEHIYHDFYSPAARERKGRAPRVQLARLTGPQYRNAIADVLLRFTPAPKSGSSNEREGDGEPEAGLRAQYFQSKGMSKANELQLERVDPKIEFDFGEGSPSENITADQFAVIWEGALFARDSGHYEFRIRSQNGVRLYLNSDDSPRRGKLRDDSSVAGQQALIDGWVSAGKMREHTARVYLLGGRRYPLRVEFFKYKEDTASVVLEWKRPHGVWSVLNQRHLSVGSVPRTYVADTPFPADDRSLGYERGSSVSPAWHAATTSASVAAADEVVSRLPLLAGLEGDDANREERLKEFVARFAEVAFRRPLSAEEDYLFRERIFAAAANPEAAVRRAVILALNSPSFLYVDLIPAGEIPSQRAVASRLSFALWDSIPDARLVEAVRHGRLGAPEEIESEAKRMAQDPRARAKITEFFDHWLELDERDMSKDETMFPEFDASVAADLRDSLDLFIQEVVWSEASDYRRLLLADHLLLNGRLRRLYQGSDACSEEALSNPEFEPVVLEPNRRAGVLTHPYLLSAFAYHNNTSPIHRGVFLTRNVVGRQLNPPPVAVAFKDSEFPPDITMREKITELTRDDACMSCHAVINPLGFALENYDAVGRWRAREKDRPIDTKSEYVTVEGDPLEIASARDIANYAVSSESAQRAFVVQAFQHLVKQSPYAYGSETVARLRAQFAEDQFNIRKLMWRIAALAAGHGRSTTLQNSN